MDKEAKALAYVVPIIALLVIALFAVGDLITLVLGLPTGLGEPLWLQFIGVIVLVLGFAQAGWLFRYRRFRNVLISTFVTFKKMARGTPLEERLERSEPLVVGGPHRYVRHPLYFGVVVMVLGWAIASNRTFVLVSTVILFGWFRLVVAPFEEKELKAIFGSDYGQYSERVPSMIPFTKPRRKRRHKPDMGGS